MAFHLFTTVPVPLVFSRLYFVIFVKVNVFTYIRLVGLAIVSIMLVTVCNKILEDNLINSTFLSNSLSVTMLNFEFVFDNI